MFTIFSCYYQYQFSCSVVSNSLLPHEPQHDRPPCPSPTARVYPNSCPLSRWCHPTISSSVVPFSSCPQSFPASGSFPMSQLFASGGQSIGVSASASVLPMSIQGRFPLGMAGLISVQGTFKSFLQHHNLKTSILLCSAFFRFQLSHPHMIIGKTIALTKQIFVGKVMFLLFKSLSRIVIFLLRSKHLLTSWLPSPSTGILEPKNKVCHCSHCFSIYLPQSDGTGGRIFIFCMLSFKPAFSLSSFISSRRSLVPLCFLPLVLVLSAYLRLLLFLPAILILASDSSSPAFPIMYSGYEINKQG